jgi:Zn-dependent protease with chaperone function
MALGLALAGLVLAIAVAYRLVAPLVARGVARRLPPVVAEQLTTATLAALDAQYFTPSTLSGERQAELSAAFDRLRLPGRASGAGYRLFFRRSAQLGPNAIALPSGTIVVTDGLVELSRDDRELIGVLAHEAGHVDRRHGLQSIVQDSLVGWMVAWAVGDARSLLAVAPTALLQAKYSRDLEEEADGYAIDALRANAIATTHLAALLERMEQARGATPGRIDVPAYLSTHPATKDRLDRLRAQ